MVFYDTPTLSITIIITAEVADQIEDKGPVNDWPWPLEMLICLNIHSSLVA